MSDPSLDALAKSIDTLRGEMIRDREFFQAEMIHRIEELRNYADLKFLTRDDHASSQARLALEVVRDVSAKLQAMVRDAMQEVAFLTVQAFIKSEEFKGEFNTLLDRRKDQDRKERREDIKSAFKGAYWILGFIIAAAQVAALLLVWLSIH
jgi:hypothetical protein